MADRFAGTAGQGTQQGTNQGADKGPSSGSGQMSSKIGEVSSAAKNIGNQAASAGRDLADRASNITGASADSMRAQADNLVDAAKGMASQAADKLKETVDGQKAVGADYVHGIADAVRRAAREFDKDLPIAGTYMRKAADQMENVSQSIKNGDMEDLVRNAQSFARRQPTAFFGIAAIAGFGIIRFLKSSSDGITSSSASNGNVANRSQTRRPGQAGA